MGNPARPEGVVSKRYVATSYGFNSKHIETCVRHGILVPHPAGIVVSSIANLKEGEHYVVCLYCGARQAAITDKHLKYCGFGSLAVYKEKYPEAQLLSVITKAAKAKTDEQKVRQSETLRARFQTPEGQVTKAQISEASKRLMAGPYREVLRQRITTLNSVPERRADMSVKSKERWRSGRMKNVLAWHQHNKDQSNENLSRARVKCLENQFTSIHASLECALTEAGLNPQREYRIGYYHVDEALPDFKLAVEADGCYWHGCPTCGFKNLSAALDARKTKYVLSQGWTVLRFWEHEIKTDVGGCVRKVLEVINAIGN